MSYILLGDFMKDLKEYGILALQFLLFLLGGSILISVGYYFLFSSKVVMALGTVYLLLIFLIFGFKSGKKTEAKGFIAGLKIGFFFLLLLLLVNLLFYRSGFTFLRFIYYFILLFSSVIGAMAGINSKKE